MRNWILFFFCIFSFVISNTTIAAINAKKGDIVIFNNALPHYPPITLKLYVCDNRLLPCKGNQLHSISDESIPIFPDTNYQIYDMQKSGSALKNKSIYVRVQIYQQPKAATLDPIELIHAYDPDEEPFYQFLCWRTDTEVDCSSGHDLKTISD